MPLEMMEEMDKMEMLEILDLLENLLVFSYRRRGYSNLAFVCAIVLRISK